MVRTMLTILVLAVLGLAGAAPLAAQRPGSKPLEVEVEPVPCIPIGDNAVAWAQVYNNVPDTTVRLYFRRLHNVVEDFYYVEMHPEGGGRYWGVFPKAEDRAFDRHELEAAREAVRWSDDDRDDQYRWAEWWRAKDLSEDRDPNDDLDDELIRERASIGRAFRRDWMYEMNDEQFQEWLESQVNEPAEYFAAVVDGQGRMLARSAVRVTEVLPPEECEVTFTPQQDGERENLTVGESGDWQRGKEVFHWLCDGVVTRIDPYLVKRGDEVCRACVIAWQQKQDLLLPKFVPPLIAIPPLVVITETSPTPVSPSIPQ
ncbi:MAG: hypothetical protein D6696_16695 [Acidobacteria bacterium]|nr:MAG: hypothetical protein D6696_16695 [Acidobacteriota bacterium]